MNIEITVKPIKKKSHNCYAGRKIIGKICETKKGYVAMTGLNQLRKIGLFSSIELAMYGIAHDEGYIVYDDIEA